MPHPGFVRSDLCSIRAAAEQAEFADAARRLLSADGQLLADHGICDLTNAAIGDVLHTCGYPVWQPGTGRARLVADHRGQGRRRDDDRTRNALRRLSCDRDEQHRRAIRLSTAAAVLAVAGVAAYVSYWHAYAVVRAHGETGITARLEPATIDGLVYASSMVILYAARHRVPVPSLARWLLGLGITATLTANMTRGWSHGPVGAVVAAWPAVSLVGSYELLVWLIRTSGTVGRGPSARHLFEDAACTGARAAAVDREQQTRTDRNPSAQDWRPAGQPGGQRTTHAHAQHDGGAPDANADNDAAVAAYRLSVQVGNPFSERKLAQMFGRTSRRWARARIAEARQSP